MSLLRATAAIACIMGTYGASGAEVPDAIAANGETVVLQAHAEGAQIYECKPAQSGGQLTWQFREPVAALFRDGVVHVEDHDRERLAALGRPGAHGPVLVRRDLVGVAPEGVPAFAARLVPPVPVANETPAAA